MENRAYALVVGVFVLLMGAAAVTAFWWFSGNLEVTRLYMVISHRSIMGLNPQAAVRFRGVRVGKVMEVDLHDSGEVRILIRVNADTPVTKGTKARVGLAGLTGQGFIQLDDDGSNPRALLPANPNDIPTIALQPGLMDDLADNGKEILARLRETSSRVERILSDDNLSRIDKTLEHLATSSDNLQKALAQTSALVTDVRRFSSSENAERLSATIAQIQSASTQLTPAVEDFRKALSKVDAAAGRIDRLGAEVQTGLTGETLPRINQLATDLQTSTQQLGRVLDDMQRSPQMMLVGKQAAQPGPGETVPLNASR